MRRGFDDSSAQAPDIRWRLLDVCRAAPRESCVRVVFPLPNGNAIVVMKPVVHADGSLVLVSEGDAFGAPGFYFTVTAGRGEVWARHVRGMRETIRVYPAGGEVRADHMLTLWKLTFLQLHYRMRRRPAVGPTPPAVGATIP